MATLARVGTRLLCPLREPSPLLSGPAPLRLSPPREGELEAAEEHPRLRARDAAVHTLPEKPRFCTEAAPGPTPCLMALARC